MTLIQQTNFLCPSCSAKCFLHLFKSANVTLDESLRDEIFTDQLNRTHCETCGSHIFVPCSVLYHDMDKEVLVWFRHQPGTDRSASAAGLPYDDMASPIRPRGKPVPVAFTWEAFKQTILYLEQGGQILTPAPPPLSGEHPVSDLAQPRPEDIARWHRQAEQGDANSQFAYAFVHYRGNGVPQNYDLARLWFDRAAALGHVEASFFLGVMLENGWGGEVDLPGAAAGYLTAAKAHFMPAQHNLGMLLLNGRGVPRDLTEARFWLSVASQNGGEHSAELMDTFESQMTPDAIESADQRQAHWVLQAITQELRPILLPK